MNKKIYDHKYFSILGDSISTFAGYNPRGYNVHYKGEVCEKTGIYNVEDTWWDNVIRHFSGELLVNNSWSGSRVTKLPQKEELFPSGCSDERTSSLHVNEIKPDVIIVYLGTNDWAFGAKTNMQTRFLQDQDEDIFDLAYDRMLNKLKKNYPQCEIWCCTLCETYISQRPDFSFPHSHAETHIEEYNDIIREVVRKNSCKLIDLYAYKSPYDTIDGSHPTKEGMNTIATMVIRSIAGDEASAIMDCSNNVHNYFVAEEYTGGTKYVCRDCGKVKYENTLYYEPMSKDDFIGKRVGDKYTALRVLSQGGVFRTYLAIEEQRNKQCVIKRFDKHHQRYSETLRSIILKEPYIVMNLNHLAIPNVLEIIEDQNSICIISEYVEGETLDVVLRNNGPIAENDVIAWAQQLCDVLGYLHKHKPPYIYRDMKPANIVLQPCGNIKLIDFDAMERYDASKNYDKCVLFTKGYAAPEAYIGRTDSRSDIFSLGMTLHQLVTGINPCEPPYETKPIREINPNLSSDMEAIILRCTQINPKERFQTCDELMIALQGAPLYPPKKKRFLDKLFGGKSSKTKVDSRV